MIKIVLLDDHELVLQGMRSKLEAVAELDIIGAYTDVEEFLLCIRYKEVDIIVMDLMLKGIHGFELIEKIKSLRKENKIILISGFYEEMLHKRALEIGVNAFLRKEASYDELISSIISVWKGNSIVPDSLIEDYNNSILTEMEMKVLKMVVDEYTNEKIARELYVSRRTVESHISNICRKLNVNSRIGIVKEAIKLKLV